MPLKNQTVISFAMYGSPSSSLRVPIARNSHARIDPPIPLPSFLLNNESSYSAIDTSIEQRIVSEAQSVDTTISSHAIDSGISALMEMGFSRGQAALACAYSPRGQLQGRVTEAAVSFANGLQVLMDLGHPISHAAGALLRSNCDVNRAADSLSK